MTSTPPDPTEAKRAHFRRLLDDGIATLHLDPRAAGIEVPKHLRNQPMLLLNYSWRYHLADFAFDGDEVIASLSFQGAPYRCVVPWRAVFAVTDPRREGVVWPDDVPPDLRQEAQFEEAQPDTARPQRAATPREARRQADEQRGTATVGTTPHLRGEDEVAPSGRGLRVVTGGRDAGSEPPPTTPEARKHLRRVK
jgi:stringent starvation protein B